MLSDTVSTHIEVFVTNIHRGKDAQQVLSLLRSRFPKALITFDLEDCDRVLRFENSDPFQAEVIEIVRSKGFQIKVMEG
jgi:hypothetical protein